MDSDHVAQISEKELQLLIEKSQRNEKILVQAFHALKERELKLKELNEELLASEEELKQSNEELYSINEILNAQKDELESALRKLKETQTLLVQAEKMASVGILTAGVAHELNNPLNFIQGGKSAVENYISEHINDHREGLQPLLEIIQIGVDRAIKIVQSLNNFSRRSNSDHEICNIHSIIDNCLVMLSNETKNRIEIGKEYSTIPCIQIGNESKLHQVFLNLLTNAIQSIDGDGIISISTQISGGFIAIRIADTGCGIHPDNIQKITDPFFTTKEPGKGTGLGLSIVFNIVKEHKGELTFESELNKGTTVLVKLPIKY